MRVLFLALMLFFIHICIGSAETIKDVNSEQVTDQTVPMDTIRFWGKDLNVRIIERTADFIIAENNYHVKSRYWLDAIDEINGQKVEHSKEMTFELNTGYSREKVTGIIVGKENDCIKLKTRDGVRLIGRDSVVFGSEISELLSRWPDFASLDDFSFLRLKPIIEKAKVLKNVDARQALLIGQLIDTIIAKIGKLKDQYPELSHFGEPEYFARGDGVFLYDYNTQPVIDRSSNEVDIRAKPLKNGCAVFFRIFPVKDRPNDYLASFFRWARSGASGVDGFGADLSITPDRQKVEFYEKIREIVNQSLGGDFYLQMAEHDLSKKALGISKTELLKAIASEDVDIADKAIRLLAAYDLQDADLRQIRKLLRKGYVSVSLVKFMEQKDKEHLPEVYTAVFNKAMEAEKGGKDQFVKTPFWGNSWDSQARGIRRHVAVELSKSSDLDFLSLVANILKSETVQEHRTIVLDYLSNVPPALSAKLLILLLDDPDNAVVLKAIEVVKKNKITDAAGKLKGLLASFDANVKNNAQATLDSFGIFYQKEEMKIVLPESVRILANTLWEAGLTEQDILSALSINKCTGIFQDCQQIPITAFNIEALAGSIKIYFETSSKGGRFSMLSDERPERLVGTASPSRSDDITGLFLLTAALKLKDNALAIRVYERLLQRYSSTEAMIESGLNAMALKCLFLVVEAYVKKDDATASELLGRLNIFEKYAKPDSYIASLLSQGKSIEDSMIQSKKMVSVQEPLPTDREAYIKYWVKAIKELGHQIVSDKLKGVGIKALPALWSAFSDKTYTRTRTIDLGYCDSGCDSLSIVPVKDTAYRIFIEICYDHGILLPEFIRGHMDLSVEKNFQKFKNEFNVWYANLPKDIKKLSASERQKFREKSIDTKAPSFIVAP